MKKQTPKTKVTSKNNKTAVPAKKPAEQKVNAPEKVAAKPAAAPAKKPEAPKAAEAKKVEAP